MTNEEKARELQLDCVNNGCGDSTDIRCACEEMADWKDQQFKDAINSVLEYFDRGREAGYVSQNSYNDMNYFASKVINKLFNNE